MRGPSRSSPSWFWPRWSRSSLGRTRRSPGARGLRSRGRIRATLCSEPLEPRKLLAVTATLSGNELQIALGAAGDTASLASAGGFYSVQGTGLSSTSFAVSGVNKITVTGTPVSDAQAFAVTSGDAIVSPLNVASTVETTTIGADVNSNASASGYDVSIASPTISLSKNISNSGGGIFFGGAVALPADVTVTAVYTSFDNKSITFAGTVDGGGALTVKNGHLTTAFNSSVGGKTPLKSLTTSAANGLSVITLGSVATTGKQSYGQLATLGGQYTTVGSAFSTTRGVTLAQDTTVTTAGGGVTFSQAVNGAKNLEIIAGSGAVNFAQAVGGTTPLGSLWIRSAGSVTASSTISIDGSAAGARQYGLAVGSAASSVSMTAPGSTITNSKTFGILLDRVQSSVFSGFTVTKCGSAGVSASGDLSGTEIASSMFRQNPTGVLLSAAQNLTINAGNVMRDNTSAGLLASGASTGTTITGSVFSDNPTGILLSGATGLLINASSGTRNTITKNTSQGVLATGTLTGTSIRNSDVYENPTGILMSAAKGFLVGAGTTVQKSSSSGLAAYGDSTGSVVEASVFVDNAIGIIIAGAVGLKVRSSAGTPNSIIGGKTTSIGIAVSGVSTGAEITGVSASGNPIGILLNGAQGVTVGNGNYFVKGTSAGLAAYGDSTGSVVTGSVFSENAIGAIVSGAKNLEISAKLGTPNSIVSSTSIGLYADGACDGTVVAGNTIASNGEGVYLSGASKLTVNGGNYIGLNTNTGVFATGALTGTKLEGNVIDSNTTGLLMSAAAGLSVGGNGAAINTIGNNKGNGLMLTGACTGSTVGANWIGLNSIGITLSAASGATFSGASTVANNTNFGLYATGKCTSTSVSAGTFATNNYGLFIFAAEGLSITGTSVTGNKVYGLYATGVCTGTNVTGNTISGNVTNIETSTATGGTFQSS